MAGGGMYSNMGSGMLGLEMSLQPQIQLPHQQQNTQNTHQMQQQHHPMVAFGHHEPEQQQQQQTNLSVKQGYPFGAKSKNHALTLSDEDEPGIGTENSGDFVDGKRKFSPWQRMKWTDNMVRLLIMVVFYIGDEAAASSEGNDISAGKKKGSGGVLQKKGKWKSVSRAMMERGFYVSPQQCEDKFNDLNKRYKRVNDILGKGTACRVVENQNLLETMDHLSAKMKEEVKKLLNSKHLFFREMCAYHNSCGHGARQSPEVGGAEPSSQQAQQQQQRCLHSSENASIAPKLVGKREEEDDDDEENDDEDEDDAVEGGARRGHEHGHHEEDEDEDEDGDGDGDDSPDDETCSRKRPQKGVFVSPMIQQTSAELTNVMQDETRNAMEKRQWIRNRLLQLEEQHVGYQNQAFELEKQRLKWVKFSSKKEREMERDKLSNERMRLENERMVLLIRQKELEFLDFCQLSRKSDPSSVTGRNL